MAGSFELHKPSLFLSVILFGQLREENSVPAEFTLFHRTLDECRIVAGELGQLR